MYKFDCDKYYEMLTKYQQLKGLTDNEMMAKLNMPYQTFYHIKYYGNKPTRLRLQRHLDSLGLKLVVDGEEFRLDDYSTMLRRIAKKHNTNLIELAYDVDGFYNNKNMSIRLIQRMVQHLGYEICVEEKTVN